MLLPSLLTESSLRNKVGFLFSSFLTCSWQTRAGLLQQEPQHLVRDFSAPRKTTCFHPSYPLGKLWLHPGNWSSVSIQWSRNLPRNMLSTWPCQWPEESCESTSTSIPWALALINAREWCFLGSEYRPSDSKTTTLGCASLSPVPGQSVLLVLKNTLHSGQEEDGLRPANVK